MSALYARKHERIDVFRFTLNSGGAEWSLRMGEPGFLPSLPDARRVKVTFVNKELSEVEVYGLTDYTPRVQWAISRDTFQWVAGGGSVICPPCVCPERTSGMRSRAACRK